MPLPLLSLRRRELLELSFHCESHLLRTHPRQPAIEAVRLDRPEAEALPAQPSFPDQPYGPSPRQQRETPGACIRAWCALRFPARARRQLGRELHRESPRLLPPAAILHPSPAGLRSFAIQAACTGREYSSPVRYLSEPRLARAPPP